MKSKAIFIFHPVTAPKDSFAYWSNAGYKVIACLPPLEKIDPYLSKGMQEVKFDVSFISTENVDEDQRIVEQYKADYDIVFGYMGWESAVEYGEQLLHRLFPDKSNDPKTSLWRYSKYAMNERLKEVGLPYVKQARIIEGVITPNVEEFLNYVPYPVVVKPSFRSAASENVYFCRNPDEAKARIQEIGHKGFLGRISEILVQEKVPGTEYFVDTFSYYGQQMVAGVYVYEKYIVKEMPVYRFVGIVEHTDPLHRLLTENVKKILTALGINFGMAHTEMMLTPENEVKLIEVNLRPSGAGGYINEMLYKHQHVNQYTLAIDALENRNPHFDYDGKHHGIFFFNNLGFIYKRVNINLILNLESYQSHKLLRPVCEALPEKVVLAYSVIWIHLANASKEQLRKDIALLAQYEKDGTLFEQ